MVTLEQLLFINDQYYFLKENWRELSDAKKEYLLLSNKKLPVFLRLLLPNITEVSEFKRLQKNEAWNKQVILLCKSCYSKVNLQFLEQAKQFERLETV